MSTQGPSTASLLIEGLGKGLRVIEAFLGQSPAPHVIRGGRTGWGPPLTRTAARPLPSRQPGSLSATPIPTASTTG